MWQSNSFSRIFRLAFKRILTIPEVATTIGDVMPRLTPRRSRRTGAKSFEFSMNNAPPNPRGRPPSRQLYG